MLLSATYTGHVLKFVTTNILQVYNLKRSDRVFLHGRKRTCGSTLTKRTAGATSGGNLAGITGG